MTILVVDDEERIGSFIVKGLTSRGHPTDWVGSGREALTWARSREPELLILDLALPDVDGLDLLDRLRSRGLRAPVIILSARGALDDRVIGLNAGADDYLPKPFAFDELLARVDARLRALGSSTSEAIAVGELEVDPRTRGVTFGGRVVQLSSREFTLLETFARSPGQVFSREQLLSRVWGLDFDPGSNVVDVYIGYLRRKVGSRIIETVRGAGYRLARSPVADPRRSATPTF